MRRLGVEVVHYQSDVTDREAMARVVAQIQERFGALHGVLHAASATDHGRFRMIAQTAENDWKRELGPKLEGARVLAEVLPPNLDFCLVDASLRVALAEKGSSVEAATHLAATALSHEVSTTYPWIVVDWDQWALHRYQLDEGSTGHVLFNLHIASDPRLHITPEEGGAVLERLLALEAPERVLISATDLEARRSSSRTSRPLVRAPMPVREKTTGTREAHHHPRPALSVPYAAPETAWQRRLCALWSEVLGVERVGIHDNFYDLGVDSLRFLEFGARLGKSQSVPLGKFFALPTVAQIASLLEEARIDPQESGGSGEAAPGGVVVPAIEKNQFEVSDGAAE